MDSVARLRLVRSDSGLALEQLLERAGRGDRDAFSRVYDQIAGLVYGLVLKVVRDPSMAEDVSQEALVEVWRRAPLFDPDRGSARSWVCRIAHSRAVDRVRSEQAHRDRTERHARSTSEEHEPSPADTIDLRDDAEVVHAALDGLTDAQRQAVTLAFFDGRTHTEVAELLDIPLGTAKTRIRDGLIKLRDSLTNQGWTR